MTGKRLAIFLFVYLVLGMPSSAWAEAALDPSHTWVFAVSSTVWKNDRSLKMPAAGREDQILMETLRARGVPSDHIVFIKDSEGTLVHIREAFAALLARTGPNDTLLFYFQGHGDRLDDPDKEVAHYYFLNYDVQEDDEKSYWFMEQVPRAIKEGFKGSHVLLTADCCRSGGLIGACKQELSGVQWACVTSVSGRNNSSGEWTYTDCLIRALRGDPQIDLDGNGIITIDELRKYVESEMAFVEQQRSASSMASDFEPEYAIARTTGPRDAAVGRHVEVKQDDEWTPAEVTATKGDACTVLLLSSRETATVPQNEMRPFHPLSLAVGTHVSGQSERDDKWYPGTVVQSYGGVHLIHFDDYSAYWDEWLGPVRVKVVSH